MSKSSKKSSTYPSAPKSFVGHLLSRSTGHPAPVRAWIQVWHALVAVAVHWLCVYLSRMSGVYVGILDMSPRSIFFVVVFLQVWRHLCSASVS